jgi:hypothetical protein
MFIKVYDCGRTTFFELTETQFLPNKEEILRLADCSRHETEEAVIARNLGIRLIRIWLQTSQNMYTLSTNMRYLYFHRLSFLIFW